MDYKNSKLFEPIKIGNTFFAMFIIIALATLLY